MKHLKFRRNFTYNTSLKDKEKFVYMHGYANCEILKFKDANTVLNIMNDYDKGCLETIHKKFILLNSNKEVLCFISYSWQENPDIFVYGDDNIAFRLSCFI